MFRFWVKVHNLVESNKPRILDWSRKHLLLHRDQSVHAAFMETLLNPPSLISGGLNNNSPSWACALTQHLTTSYIVAITFHQVQLMVRIRSAILKGPNKGMIVQSHTNERPEVKRTGLFPVLCYWESCVACSEKASLNYWPSQNSPWKASPFNLITFSSRKKMTLYLTDKHCLVFISQWKTQDGKLVFVWLLLHFRRLPRAANILTIHTSLEIRWDTLNYTAVKMKW